MANSISTTSKTHHLKIPIATHKKAHADSTGFLELLNSFDAATRQGLASDPLLIKLFDLLPDNSLISVTDDLTTDDAKIVGTAGTIAILLKNKQGDIVGAVFYTPNSKAKPIVIDYTGYGAIVTGDLNKANEVLAFADIDNGIEVYACLMTDDKTIIISPQTTNQHLKKMVQHWSSGSQVTVPMTLDDKVILNQLAGIKAQALITDAHIVTKLQNSESYDYIKEQAIEIIELADTANYPECWAGMRRNIYCLMVQ